LILAANARQFSFPFSNSILAAKYLAKREKIISIRVLDAQWLIHKKTILVFRRKLAQLVAR
jgi:hypothetical protein